MVNWYDSLSKAYRSFFRELPPIIRQKHCVTLACLYTILAAPIAHAGITIAPLRGIVSQDHQQLTFTISNPSQRLMDARISLIDLQATEEGYETPTISARRKISAAPWLTVSPVTFSLEPGSRQEVLVTLRKDIAIPNREKRSHLYVETGPSRAKIHRISTMGESTGLGLDARLAISVPIILRGNNIQRQSGNVRFNNTKLVRDKAGLIELETTLMATDLPISLNGTISIEHKPNTPVKEELIFAPIKNVPLYTDVKKRKISIPLNSATLKKATITLTYTDTDEFQGLKLASKTFEIGG